MNLAWAYTYFDANNVASTFQVQLNGALVGISTQNVRTTVPMIVKAGDIISVKRWSGTASVFHEGRIRKIF